MKVNPNTPRPLTPIPTKPPLPPPPPKPREFQACPLSSFCNCKSAVCDVLLPDESCYWFRWFEKRIKEVKKK